MSDWKKIFETEALHMAHIAKDVLMENNIPAVIKNTRDSSLPVYGKIRVLVRSEDEMKAQEIINTLKI
ncbi:MAG: DUF2007 domain-containing protein [Bacteroidales bacterium]